MTISPVVGESCGNCEECAACGYGVKFMREERDLFAAEIAREALK